jgi:hypothetical protein
MCEQGGLTNLTQLHQLCQEEWAKIHPIYCEKLVEGYWKRLTQVKQFNSIAVLVKPIVWRDKELT